MKFTSYLVVYQTLLYFENRRIYPGAPENLANAGSSAPLR